MWPRLHGSSVFPRVESQQEILMRANVVALALYRLASRTVGNKCPCFISEAVSDILPEPKRNSGDSHRVRKVELEHPAGTLPLAEYLFKSHLFQCYSFGYACGEVQVPYGPGCDGKEVVSLLMWVLETKFRYSARAVYIL